MTSQVLARLNTNGAEFHLRGTARSRKVLATLEGGNFPGAVAIDDAKSVTFVNLSEQIPFHLRKLEKLEGSNVASQAVSSDRPPVDSFQLDRIVECHLHHLGDVANMPPGR